ncbi:g2468 [Coccomyxa elongata]
MSLFEPRSKNESLVTPSLFDDALHTLMKEQLVRAIGKTLKKPGNGQGCLSLCAAEESCSPLATQDHKSAPPKICLPSLAEKAQERNASGAYTHDPTRTTSSAPPMLEQDIAPADEEQNEKRRRRVSFGGVAPPPPEFFCPISHCLMTEPVTLLNTGITFNRTSMQAWMRTGGRNCPVTGQPLQGWIALESNEKLRLRIVAWVQEQGINFDLLDNAAVLMHQLYRESGSQ